MKESDPFPLPLSGRRGQSTLPSGDSDSQSTVPEAKARPSPESKPAFALVVDSTSCRAVRISLRSAVLCSASQRNYIKCGSYFYSPLIEYLGEQLQEGRTDFSEVLGFADCGPVVQPSNHGSRSMKKRNCSPHRERTKGGAGEMAQWIKHLP